MATAGEILSVVEVIAGRFKPQRIVLYGSYAYGAPTEDSDVDLLVIMNHRGSSHDQSVRIRLALDVAFPLDLTVRRLSTIQQRIRWNDFFLREVMDKGLVLYATDDRRMGEQGRRRLRRRLASAEIAQAKPLRSNLLPRPAVRRKVS